MFSLGMMLAVVANKVIKGVNLLFGKLSCREVSLKGFVVKKIMRKKGNVK